MSPFQTSTDSLDEVEDFAPVDIDLDSLKHVLNKYEKHRKISMTKLQQHQPQKKIWAFTNLLCNYYVWLFGVLFLLIILCFWFWKSKYKLCFWKIFQVFTFLALIWLLILFAKLWKYCTLCCDFKNARLKFSPNILVLLQKRA